MEHANIIIRTATAADIAYAEIITAEMESSAKARGTGIAKRSPEYLIKKMEEGKAVIALTPEGEWVGFCYIEAWGHDAFVANSGLIVAPAYRNSGIAIASSVSTIAFNGSNSPLYLGIYDGTSYPYNGDLAEVVMYATDLSGTNRRKVESYLALKWGLTLDQSSNPINYIASNGVTVWDAALAGDYSNNIAGIVFFGLVVKEIIQQHSSPLSNVWARSCFHLERR